MTATALNATMIADEHVVQPARDARSASPSLASAARSADVQARDSGRRARAAAVRRPRDRRPARSGRGSSAASGLVRCAAAIARRQHDLAEPEARARTSRRPAGGPASRRRGAARRARRPRAWAPSARSTLSATVPSRRSRERAVRARRGRGPARRPPDRRPARAWTPRSRRGSARCVVGATRRPPSTPGTRRASATADGGRPGPSPLQREVGGDAVAALLAPSRAPGSCRRTASEPAIATVSTSGVLAEEKRRAAERTFATARKPPTARRPRDERARHPRRDTGDERAEARGGDDEDERDARGGRGGGVERLRRHRHDRRARWRRRSPPGPRAPRTGPIRRGSTAASWRARVGATRAARRAAAHTATHAVSTPPTTAADGGERAGVDRPCPRARCPRSANAPPERAAERDAGHDARRGTRRGRAGAPPSRSCAAPGAGSRRWRAGARSRARGAGSARPSVLATTNIAMSSASPPNVPAIAITASRASATLEVLGPAALGCR